MYRISMFAINAISVKQKSSSNRLQVSEAFLHHSHTRSEVLTHLHYDHLAFWNLAKDTATAHPSEIYNKVSNYSSMTDHYDLLLA